MKPSRLTTLATVFALFAGLSPAGETPQSDKAADQRGAAVSNEQNATEIDLLKKQLAEQQKQIEDLRLIVLGQKKQIDNVTKKEAVTVTVPSAVAPSAATSTQVASTVPYIPSTVLAKASPLPPVIPFPVTPPPQKSPGKDAANPCEAAGEAQSPTFIHIGDTCLVPVGFMDFTSIWRDKNAASGIGSNFGNIPFNNATAGMLSEFRFSPQNSRLGFRFDGSWKGAHFMAYNEFDFLGTSGTNNLGVTNGAFVPRIRLFWVDVRKDNLEFLAGQSWSLLTPNRTGLSALPGDLFYSQAIDVNYMAGLTWSRQPGARILYHAMNDKFTAGISFENPDQYIGGSGGSSATAVTLPAAAALSGIGGTQVDNATNVLNTPNLKPDIIAKIAFDPSKRFHFEVGGVERTFKIYDSATRSYSTKEGAGVLIGANGEIAKGLRLISTNFWSDGGGRYLFGQAPDFMVRADGSISPIHAGGTVDGFELTVKKNTLLYAYYGAYYIGKDTALDANGTTKIGYGYAGSANSDNRAIQEISFGFNETIWKSARYGAINFMGQYEYLTRDPWAVLTGQPKAAHDNSLYFNVRYTLPGSMPPIK
ncbi:MAG TPA: hypothetical protein VGL53_18370 [Bryobacteraceae bacterium]|jgi:hypothetical protein